MKNLIPIAFLFLAVPAFAKITLFSAGDALAFTLSSTQLSEAKSTLPNGYDLSSVRVEQSGDAPDNSFQFTLVYSPKEAPPAGVHADCLVTAQTQSHVVHVGPNNSITASELTPPVVQGPGCQN